jgi:hypothetical protein
MSHYTRSFTENKSYACHGNSLQFVKKNKVNLEYNLDGWGDKTIFWRFPLEYDYTDRKEK